MCKCNPAIRKAICPKCYTIMPTPPDWLTRLINHREDFHDMTYNLGKFIDSPKMDECSDQMRHALLLKQSAMRAYLDTLNNQITVAKLEE